MRAKAPQAADTRKYWQLRMRDQRPKILIGSFEYQHYKKVQEDAARKVSGKVTIVYGEAAVGELVLFPLPYHNHGQTRVDFEITVRFSQACLFVWLFVCVSHVLQ